MKTEKLYYKDSYIKEFTAKVLSVNAVGEDKYEILLDRTAFFPGEAGQSADTGTLDTAEVVDVIDREGLIYHITASPLAPHSECVGKIHFHTRFMKMQCHTAEHILSGIFHSKYGMENVGFHLGCDMVTFDMSSPVTPSMAEEVEYLANKVIYDNKRVTARLYESSPADQIKYRSKKEIDGEVRLVFIEDTDVCACCAPHVKNTGEIGIIKLLKTESHKGGSRIYMLAGEMAYKWLSDMKRDCDKLSRLLSSPPLNLAPECERLIEEKRRLEGELYSLKLSSAVAIAGDIPVTSCNAVLCLENADNNILREAANVLSERVCGLSVAVSERPGGISYVIIGKGDISSEIKKANAALFGKGGGRGNMAQGSFGCELSQIKSYFGV